MDAQSYQIESGIPVNKTASGRNAIYPFSKMEIGDSFALLANDADELSRVRAAASWYGTRHNQKFAVRLSDRDERLYRCWRIA